LESLVVHTFLIFGKVSETTSHLLEKEFDKAKTMASDLALSRETSKLLRKEKEACEEVLVILFSSQSQF